MAACPGRDPWVPQPPMGGGRQPYDYTLTDPLAFLCLSAAVYFMATGNRRGFFAAAIVGVFVKEIVAAVLVAYLVRQAAARRLWVSDFLATLAVVTSYAAFRFLLHVPENAYDWRIAYLGLPKPQEMGLWFYATFLSLSIPAIARLWRTSLAWPLLPLVALAALAALFASNRERALIYAYPTVIVALLGVVARDRIALSLQLFPVAALPIAASAYLWTGTLVAIQAAAVIGITAAAEAALLWRLRGKEDTSGR